MRLSEALASYTTQLAADGRATHTIAQARRHGRMLVAALDDPPAARVTYADVARFLASDAVKRTADGRPRRASSANALRSSIRAFTAYLHGAGITPTNAGRLVRRARVPPAPPRALPEADLDRLLNATQRHPRDRAMVLLMARAGLRVGSLVALDVGDLDGDQLTLRGLKGGGTDTVYLPRDLVEALRAQVGDRAEGPLFERECGGRLTTRQVARRLAQHAAKASIAGANPHALRHRFGCDVYARTNDVLLTARALTHRSVASTAVYARASEAQIRAAVGA